MELLPRVILAALAAKVTLEFGLSASLKC